VLLVFEFYVAGVGIAGGVGALFLVLAAYGLAVLPTRPVGLALILLSMLAFAIDVQTGVPRVWTGIGTAAFTAGSLLLYDGLSLSWITLLAAIAGVLLAMLAGMPTMIRTRFATPTIGREWMIGEMGEATADIDPDGVVRVRGALWRARTNRATPLRAGDSVRVVDIDGPVLEVEPETGGARDYREHRRKAADAPENPSGLADRA
jgi:membrane-bound serine protease (ClpP class)